MLALAGLTFTYTSCTDYSEDINANTDRIDAALKTIEQQAKDLQSAKAELEKADAAADAAIKALQSNTASLQDELKKLQDKHTADIAALTAEHAADKAALELALANKASELKDAITALDSKYALELGKIDAAYKQADVEIKSQIAQNVTKIDNLTADVKKLSDEVIPAVKKQIEDLAKSADATYATKAELTKATADVIATVNTETAKLSKSIESVSDRLTELSTAHEALKKSFEEAKDSHDATLKALEGKLNELKSTQAADVTRLEGLIKKAQDAADAAKTAADEAGKAAKAAQETADKAVADAKAAADAAKAAQESANNALGQIKELQDALGVYAKEGELAAKIQELLNADKALAEKDILLAKADSALLKKYDELVKQDVAFADLIKGLQATADDLTKKYGDLAAKIKALEAKDLTLDEKDAELENLIKDLKAEDVKIYAEIQSLSKSIDDVEKALDEAKKAIDAKIKKLGDDIQKQLDDLKAEDIKLAGEIAKKFDADKFAEEFKKSFDKAFDGEDFKTAFTEAIKKAFGGVETFDAAFTNALKGTEFSTVYADFFTKNLETETYKNDFKCKFGDLIDAEILTTGKIGQEIESAKTAASTALTEAVNNINNNVIGTIEGTVEQNLKTINARIDDIVLVIGDLANRIQSIVFVPQYSDMNATVYVYTVGDKPISDEKIVEATFEVYPKSAAKYVTRDSTKLVAVNVANADTRADVKLAVPGEFVEGAEGFNVDPKTGRVTVKAKFGKEVEFEKGKKSFAVSLRVENTVSLTEKENGPKTTNHVESAFVGVTQASKCDLKAAYGIYDFVNQKVFDGAVSVEKAWSVSMEDAKWTPFTVKEGDDEIRYGIGLKIGEKFCTIKEAADLLHVSEAALTPVLSSDVNYIDKAGDKDKKNIGPYYSCETFEDAAKLADFSISMTEKAQAKGELAKSVGSYCTNAIAAKVVVGKDAKGKDIMEDVINKTLTYKIVEREAKVTLYINKKDHAEKFELPWTYKNVCDLTTDASKDAHEPFDKPLDKTFDKRFAEYYPVFEYAGADDVESVLKDVLKNKVDQKAFDAKGVEVPGLKMELDPYTLFNADLVEIKSIEGYKGCFVDGGTYRFENTYKDEATKTKVTISTEMVFGVAPKDATVTINNIELPFLLETEKKCIEIKDLIKNTFYSETKEGQFKDLPQFKTSLAEHINSKFVKPATRSDNAEWYDKHVTKVERTSIDDASSVDLKASGWTYFAPYDSTKTYDADYNPTVEEGFESYIRLSGSDIKAFGDKFNFETTIETWYGTTYTFVAKGTVKTPDYSLSFFGDKVNVKDTTASVEVYGDADVSPYRIKKDDLSKYFRVTNREGKFFVDERKDTIVKADRDLLTVVYKLITENDEDRGYKNVESVVYSDSPISVDKMGVIGGNTIDWGDFTSRDIHVKATLMYATKVLDSKVLLLEAVDPVTMTVLGTPEGKTFEVTRVPNKDLIVDVWRKLDIRSTVEPELKNMVNVEAKTIAGIWWNSHADEKYGVTLKYNLDRRLITVNGVNDPLSADKVDLSADGVLTYKADAAKQVGTVVIPVEVTMTHFYDRAKGVFDNHKETILIKVIPSE